MRRTPHPSPQPSSRRKPGPTVPPSLDIRHGRPWRHGPRPAQERRGQTPHPSPPTVIPAEAGTHGSAIAVRPAWARAAEWLPACAGMTALWKKLQPCGGRSITQVVPSASVTRTIPTASKRAVPPPVRRPRPGRPGAPPDPAPDRKHPRRAHGALPAARAGGRGINRHLQKATALKRRDRVPLQIHFPRHFKTPMPFCSTLYEYSELAEIIFNYAQRLHTLYLQKQEIQRPTTHRTKSIEIHDHSVHL